MVKNTHGGSGHKKFARKNFSSSKKTNKLRVAEDEGEIYSIATKMCGNGMFLAFGIDGVERLVHIRGKFTGRGKRDNCVTPGTWILAGIREWEKAEDGKGKEKRQQCDLLEVYSDFDKDRLMDTVSEEWHILLSNDVSRSASGPSDTADYDLSFASEKDLEREKFIEEMQSTTAARVALKIKETEDKEDEEEVNFEDI